MPDDPRVRELLDGLLDQDATPEEVCQACPELLPVVRERWRQIRRARAELDALLPVTPTGGSSTPSPDQLPLPQIPGYEVEGVLGHGGMGVVFRARHLRLGRYVALKMTLAGAYAGPHERERFRREAEAVAALRHANVVQIYDVGDWADRPYFTMELVEGGSLAQKLAGVPQPSRQAAELVAALAQAVQAAHEGGIVHRDLKPANIMLTPAGVPKITDFGLARRVEDGAGLTRTGVPLGTPSYMAPEQAGGRVRDIGPAVDIYALGTILYELLTGRLPFRGETSTETLLQVINQEPVPPSRLNGKVPRDLETICLKCLQKEPRLRYPTAVALADDLGCFLRGEAISARPTSRLSLLGRWLRRRPFLAGAVVIAALSTLSLAGAGLWLLSDRSVRIEAAHEDVRDMIRYLNESSWVEAGAARDRANGRLGHNAPADLRHQIDRGTRDLELAARLDALSSKGVDAIAGGILLSTYHTEFMDAFRAAGLGTYGDDPEVVAGQIRQSHIREALVAALDRYSLFIFVHDRVRGTWAMEVVRKADRDQSGWRLRARDLKVIDDRVALKELMATRPTADPSMIPQLAFEAYLGDEQVPVADRLALLRRLHQTRPGDFWLNLRVGGFLRHYRMNNEAVGYIQTATALRPESAFAHWHFGGVLWDVGRREEAAEQFRQGTELDPTIEHYHEHYARRLSELGRHEAAVEHLRTASLTLPRSSILSTELGHCLDRQGREDEALVWFTKAVELDPANLNSQKALRDCWLKRGKLDGMQVAWKATLADKPPKHSAWYGYAELCLFLGKEEEFLRARRELLTRFAGTSDPLVAERTSRAYLIFPATGKELDTAVALAERALAVDRTKYPEYYPYFLFARGLGEFRQGQFDKAIATMKGDGARVLSPAPRLVLAMALYKGGQEKEARQTLAAAIAGHDWRPVHCTNQDERMIHILRREAEKMIVPDLPAYLAGTAQPRDNDERLSMIGIGVFTGRAVLVSRMYADAFAADPKLPEALGGHRDGAARAAARAGCGRGSDAADATEAERVRWRGQAVQWLREELAGWSKRLDNPADKSHSTVLKRLRQWQTEDDFAGLRDPDALKKLPEDERPRCQELWAEVQAVLTRHGNKP